MEYKQLNQVLGHVDIYLLDQILKGRFEGRKRLLDAGCGEGRNLRYFADNKYEVHGIDTNPTVVKMCKMSYPEYSDNFFHNSIEYLEFDDDYFNSI
ncbi:MAG: methyltransferase domain-containing protein, partial [Fulvivirga sp.]|nr:methyltransferase domain-containing protein [Fulvivirga sp.]